MKMQDGEALGALHHDEIGDIDLVWRKVGTRKNDGYGLAKLVKFHPEVLDNLHGVLGCMHVTKRTENHVQLENEESQEAVAQAQADYEARKKSEAERKAVGNEKPMPAIADKWDNTPKADGHKDEIALPDGTKLKGHYVLHESGASSPSHNPQNWQKTEGFPMDANDNSVNDRDYERDHDAQEHTKRIAEHYDQRALQSVPVVSHDGVVLSGNGRTMVGELAAQNNTDGAYVNYLGFTK